MVWIALQARGLKQGQEKINRCQHHRTGNQCPMARAQQSRDRFQSSAHFSGLLALDAQMPDLFMISNSQLAATSLLNYRIGPECPLSGSWHFREIVSSSATYFPEIRMSFTAYAM